MDRTQAQGVSFFSGCVWAEMKKTVSYKVDLAVNSHGVIEEAQCECAVGQGPTAHCKHVGCVLYGLIQFSSKQELLTEQTCTQVYDME